MDSTTPKAKPKSAKPRAKSKGVKKSHKSEAAELTALEPAVAESKVDGEEEQLSKKEKRRRDFINRTRERAGYEHDWYIARRANKKPLLFDTTGGTIKGLLGRFRVYEFEVKVARNPDPLVVKKLDTFTISDARDSEFLTRHLKLHQPTRDKKLRPQPGAGYHPPLAEGAVKKAIDGQKALAVMLLNGRIIVGVPVEESMYSILLKVPDSRGREILVYKHGLAGGKLLEDIQPPSQ